MILNFWTQTRRLKLLFTDDESVVGENQGFLCRHIKWSSQLGNKKGLDTKVWISEDLPGGKHIFEHYWRIICMGHHEA